jgi:hypothetical protein
MSTSTSPKHPGWCIEVKYNYTGSDGMWKGYYTPREFASKRSLESVVRQNLRNGQYGREYRVVEKTCTV